MCRSLCDTVVNQKCNVNVKAVAEFYLMSVNVFQVQKL